MDVDVLFAGTPVSDVKAAKARYERFFARPADVVAHEAEVMWQVTDRGWLYIGFSNGELLSLMDGLQAERADLFMRAIAAMPDRAFGAGIGARRFRFFSNLAQNPRGMQFLINTGYRTFSALYRHAGYDFARFGEYALAAEDLADCCVP